MAQLVAPTVAFLCLLGGPSDESLFLWRSQLRHYKDFFLPVCNATVPIVQARNSTLSYPTDAINAASSFG